MGVRDKLLVIAAYALLTLLLTFPLATEFSTSVAGSGDVWKMVWNLWWVKKAVTELNTTPYHTDFILYPTGVNLSFHTLTLLNSLFAIPLQAFFTLTESYNILVYLTFILAGYGAYLLSDYVLSDRRIAFVCGFIYAFSPYHVHEVWSGHLHIAAIQWIPYFVLYLMKTIREGGRNSIYAGFFLALISLSEWQYMGVALIYSLFAVGYQLPGESSARAAVLANYAAMLACFSLLIAPFAYPLIREFLSSDYMVYSPLVFLGVSQSYSLDLASPLVPNFMNTFFGKNVIGALREYGRPPYESFISVGYVVLGLSILPTIRKWNFRSRITSETEGVKRYFHKRTLPYTAALLLAYLAFIHQPLKEMLNTTELKIAFTAYIILSIVPYALARRSMGFWGASAIAFFLLSLGPGLTILGKVYPFPLPYFFSVILPPFRIFRTPYRFYVIVTLALALLAGKSLKEIARQKKHAGYAIPAILILLLVEYTMVPYPTSSAAIPPVYDVIQDDAGDFGVLEVPIMPIFKGDNKTKYMIVYAEPEYYQTRHEKKLVGGYISRYPTKQLRFLEETVLLRELRGNTGGGAYHPSDGAAMLRTYNIRYVLLHRDFYSSETLPSVERLLNDTLGGNVIYRPLA